MFDPDYDLFLDIVDAGSISAAARARNASVASLSKRLARLEGRIGARLAHRTTRRLTLTTAGRDLADTLRPLRESLDAAERRISGRGKEAGGPVRITAPTSYGRIHVLPCLPAFLSDNPQVQLTIDLSDQYVDLLDGTYDLAVRIGAGAGTGLKSYRLSTSGRVLCASPDYLEHFGTPETLRDLDNHHLLAADGQLPWHLDGPNGTVVHPGTSHVQTNSSEVVRELAVAGCGIALRSLWDVNDALCSGELCRVLPQYQGSQDVGIYAVHAPTPVVPSRLTALIEHLAKHLGADNRPL